MTKWPANVKIVTVSSKSQITIPKALLERWDPEAALRQKAQELLRALHPQPGDKVRLWVERGILRVQPVKPVPKQPRRS